MLLGAGVLLGALATVLQLTRAPEGFIMPGTGGRHVMADAVVPVLAAGGGIFVVLGLASLLIVRRPPVRLLRLAPRPKGRSRRPFVILLGGLALLAVAILLR